MLAADMTGTSAIGLVEEAPSGDSDEDPCGDPEAEEEPAYSNRASPNIYVAGTSSISISMVFTTGIFALPLPVPPMRVHQPHPHGAAATG